MKDNIDLERCSVVWLDDSEENIIDKQQFHDLDRNLQVFNRLQECEDYIKSSQSADTPITLIVNGDLAQQIIPNIHELSQINAIYIYDTEKKTHEEWIANYAKINGVFHQFSLLQTQLQPKHVTKNRSIVSEVPTTIEPQIETIPVQHLYDVDISYMISDTCFDYLRRIKTIPTDIDSCTCFYQQILQGDDTLLAILREFQEGYTGDQAVSWLFRHIFFNECLDYIFQIQQIRSIFLCRIFIQDIYKQLEQHQYTSTIEVYRYEKMSNEQFQQLKTYNGKIISMKRFLVTNSDLETTLSDPINLSSTDDCKYVLFTIQANPQIPHIKPFAKMSSLISDNDPNDILFMIGSLFKIIDIEDEKDGRINIKMTLCGNDIDNTVKMKFDQLTCQTMDNGEADVIGFGKLVFFIGRSVLDKTVLLVGEEIVRSYLSILPMDHPDQLRCCDALGEIELQKNELGSSIDWYQKSLEMKKTILPPNNLQLAESYKNLATVYLQKQDYPQALGCFQQLLIISKALYGDEHNDIFVCYGNMASIYEKQDRLFDAFSCYCKAEIILMKLNATKSMSFAILYNNLGKIRTCLGQYELALGYYKISLEIKSSLLTSIDPSLATTYSNIGVVYSHMGHIEQAREHFEKAAEIYRQIQPIDNSNLIEIEQLIQDLSTSENQ